MGKIIECAQDSASQKNTGANEQCLVGPVVRHMLAKTDFQFTTKELAKTLSEWKDAVAAKDIIPLFNIEVLANANIDATFYEARSRYKTKSEKKVVTAEVHLGVCSYAALYSYNGKKMRLFEFTDDQKITGVTDTDSTIVKGQLVTIEVGMLIPSLDDKPQFALVTITYEDWKEFINNPVVLSPSWSHIDLNGIFDVEIEQVSASSTEVKFKVNAGCVGDEVTALEDGDIVFTTADGTAVTHSFVEADANGVYTLTGTGFVTGSLISLNGVVQQTEATYEAVEPLAIVI